MLVLCKSDLNFTQKPFNFADVDHYDPEYFVTSSQMLWRLFNGIS